MEIIKELFSSNGPQTDLQRTQNRPEILYHKKLLIMQDWEQAYLHCKYIDR